MNLEHIQTFIAVYRSGNFAAVAKERNIAPSSVSRAIATLEKQLHTRLFQRTTRKLTPTQSGEYYFHKVVNLVEALESTQHEVVAQNSEPYGTLKVTASASFGQMILAPLLVGFHQQYPKINLELTLSDSQSDLITDQYDLAIRHGKLNDSGLVVRKLVTVRYLLVAHPDYLSQTPEIQTPEDVQKHNIITFSYRDFKNQWLFRQHHNEQQIPITPSFTTTNALALKTCAAKGMGITLLPDWSVKTDIESGDLIQLLPQWEIAGSEYSAAIWLLYPSRIYTPTKTHVFIDYIMEHIEKNMLR